MSRIYATRGSRKGPSVDIGDSISGKVLTEIRRDIFKAARLWGVAYVSLFPDGSIMMSRRYVQSRHYIGAYDKRLTSEIIREDLLHAMSLMLGGTIKKDCPHDRVECTQHIG